MVLTPATQSITKCFISAPYGADLRALHSSLAAHGIQRLVPRESHAGMDWVSSIRQAIEHSDLVVGVVPNGGAATNVAFEIGLACALGRRILVISPSRIDWLPSAHSHILTIRTSVDNQQAIDFALAQWLHAPVELRSREVKQRGRSRPLGADVDHLMERLTEWKATKKSQDLEDIVGAALRASGLNVIVGSANRQYGVDFAVWSEAFQAFINNPLLVEVKPHVRDPRRLAEVFRRITSELAPFGPLWTLLVYAEGPNAADPAWRGVPQRILPVPLPQLLASLRVRSFPEIVRDLRNERVHGSSI